MITMLGHGTAGDTFALRARTNHTDEHRHAQKLEAYIGAPTRAWRARALATAAGVWLDEVYTPVREAPGCYWIEPQWHTFLWIAANELPLLDELVPFLLARSGQALDEFCRWVAPRRPLEWVLTMLDYLPMSTPTHEELLWRFGKAEDPVIEARRQRLLDFLLETSPQKKQQLIDTGRLTEARAALRRVLAGRQLTPSQDDDARIDGCTDLETLERWHDRTINATSVSDVLR